MEVAKNAKIAVGKKQVLGLDYWNAALFRHYFIAPEPGPVEPLVRLYITGDELRTAGELESSSEEARAVFIEAVRNAVGPKSLASDAVRRRMLWLLDSEGIPPFLSHLLLTCMVANDLAEDLRWTGNFRTRLCQILGTNSQSQLECLREVWEDLAAWSESQNISGARCRPLRLPRIPDCGYHSIIGYSLRLAIPSRRDQAILVKIIRGIIGEGEEPELNSILHAVNSNVGRFSVGFQEAFSDFAAGVMKQFASSLYHTTFWSAVREAILSCQSGATTESNASERVRLELEDDDGKFWLTLTSDSEIDSNSMKSEPLPQARSSPFRFRLRGTAGLSPVGTLFSPSQTVEPILSGLRALVSGGLLLFEEADDYVFTLCRRLPSSGVIRALVSDRLTPDFSQALVATGLKPEITISDHAGWSEWRGLTIDALRRVDFCRFASLAGIRALRLVIPRPEIRLRGGIRVGGSYVALPSALPLVEIAEASRVDLIGVGCLERSPDSKDIWTFPGALEASRLVGTRRLAAFTDSGVLTERAIDFVETTFTSEYKQPLDPSRWLTESATIDMVPLSESQDYAIPFANDGAAADRRLSQLSSYSNPVGVRSSVVRLATLLCTRFAAIRGISEGELVAIFAKELGVSVDETWLVLRGWVEGGMLEVLSDARWRGRTYFGRVPHLVVHRAKSDHEAVLVGLVPPWLLDRFHFLSLAFGLDSVETQAVSEFVPALPRVRSKSPALLTELAKELGLARPVRLRGLEDFLRPVSASVNAHSSTMSDAWPRYRGWDWERRAYADNPREAAVRGISIEWCRRDDGPDRYKLYRDGNIVCWTRSRTWAMLAAFTLAHVPVFARVSPVTVESRGDSLNLPLPVARIVSCVGPANPGPVQGADGRSVYRYTFLDRTLCDLVLSKLWPGSAGDPMLTRDVVTILRSGQGPLFPVPMTLKRHLARVFGERSEPRFVSATSLPRLYSVFEVLKETGEQ